jgi:glycosyltransferase involved in cell wall biosynthesis
VRVAIETTPLTRPGCQRGLGRYAGTVLESARRNGYDVIPVSLRRRSGRTQPLRDLLDRSRKLAKLDLDVFHATHTYATARRTRAKTVVSVLDVIPLEVGAYRRLGANAALFHRVAARADRVLTLSRFSAQRIATRLGVAADKIVVAPLPPSPGFRPVDRPQAEEVLQRLGVNGPYFCSLVDMTTSDPRKRAGWLPLVAERLAQEGYTLVVAGGGTRAAFSGHPSILALDRVSDEDLAALHSRALAFVYTSAYEGQGLPPLEAMACGAPVVAMRNSSIPEVVGSGGMLVDEIAWREPVDARASRAGADRLAGACLELARDERRRDELADNARAVSGQFTVALFDQQVAFAYEK